MTQTSFTQQISINFFKAKLVILYSSRFLYLLLPCHSIQSICCPLSGIQCKYFQRNQKSLREQHSQPCKLLQPRPKPLATDCNCNIFWHYTASLEYLMKIIYHRTVTWVMPIKIGIMNFTAMCYDCGCDCNCGRDCRGFDCEYDRDCHCNCLYMMMITIMIIALDNK